MTIFMSRIWKTMLTIIYVTSDFVHEKPDNTRWQWWFLRMKNLFVELWAFYYTKMCEKSKSTTYSYYENQTFPKGGP